MTFGIYLLVRKKKMILKKTQKDVCWGGRKNKANIQNIITFITYILIYAVKGFKKEIVLVNGS